MSSKFKKKIIHKILKDKSYSRDKDLQAFADFWRPIVILDGSLWFEKTLHPFLSLKKSFIYIGNVLCIHII
jgi:hypothetical protein